MTVILIATAIAALDSGCFTNVGSGASTSSAVSASPTAVSLPSGPMAARIFFNIPGSAPASFNAPPAAGTPVGPVGSGLGATSIYYTDSDTNPTPISTSGPSDSAWPQWISRVEIGLSGPNNTGAPNPNCARFSTAADVAAAPTCNGVSCGAPAAGMFRISEYDCQSGANTLSGSGLATDPVYIRAVFNRANLGVSENIMAVLQYAASGLYTAPTDPSGCFNLAGIASPTSTNCSDMSWEVFLQSALATSGIGPNPFMLLIPPTSGFINPHNLPLPGTLTPGAQIVTKQIILPIAANSTLTTLELSRINALNFATDPNFSTLCTSNSPLCLGVIFYSLTFYRI